MQFLALLQVLFGLFFPLDSSPRFRCPFCFVRRRPRPDRFSKRLCLICLVPSIACTLISLCSLFALLSSPFLSLIFFPNIPASFACESLLVLLCFRSSLACPLCFPFCFSLLLFVLPVPCAPFRLFLLLPLCLFLSFLLFFFAGLLLSLSGVNHCA